MVHTRVGLRFGVCPGVAVKPVALVLAAKGPMARRRGCDSARRLGVRRAGSRAGDGSAGWAGSPDE